MEIRFPRLKVTGPSFCTTANERVYITAMGCELELSGLRGLQAAGAGGVRAANGGSPVAYGSLRAAICTVAR